MAGRVSERVAVEAAAPAKPSPKQVLTTLLERNKGAIGLSLPRGMDQDRFVRLLLTATATNPKLLECDPLSFLRAGVISAQLGLEPNDPRGEAYLIPYGKQVQFQPGYKGLMKLARRAGAAAFGAEAVFEGDEFGWEQGSESWLKYRARGEDDPAKITHAWALAKVDGEPEFTVMFRAQVDKVMRDSEAYKRAERNGKRDSPWHLFYAEMAVKTAIKRLCKKLPQNAELMRAIEVDDSAERGLVIEGVDLSGDDSVIDTTEAGPELEQAPTGVDRQTGEVIDVTSTDEPTPDDAAEIDQLYDADDPERPF